MDGIWVVKDDITGFKVRDQPLALALGFVAVEAACVVGKLPEIVHMYVEGAHALGFGQCGGATSEVVFDSMAEGSGVGEVDEATAVEGDIACEESEMVSLTSIYV